MTYKRKKREKKECNVNIIKQRLYQVQIKEVQRIAPIKKFSHEAISGKPSKKGEETIKTSYSVPMRCTSFWTGLSYIVLSAEIILAERTKSSADVLTSITLASFH